METGLASLSHISGGHRSLNLAYLVKSEQELQDGAKGENASLGSSGRDQMICQQLSSPHRSKATCPPPSQHVWVQRLPSRLQLASPCARAPEAALRSAACSCMPFLRIPAPSEWSPHLSSPAGHVKLCLWIRSFANYESV